MASTSGGFGSSGWQILEHDSYDESVLHCGGHFEIEDAIGWLDLFLNRNPLGFAELTPGSDIRVAKTKLRISGGRVFPACRLLFTADAETRTVTKLHVAFSQPEDMLYGDPWSDNEPPF